MDRFYITTPIYYVNAKPHLGHAYTTIVADSLNRFHKALGKETFFLTGTDEHGDKIVQAAEKAGKTPQEYVDEISGLFRDLWPTLSVEHDRFIRTTDPEHKKVVQAMLQKAYDAGDIYHGEYGGHYCTGCERFYTEKELSDPDKPICPDHKTPLSYIAEKNYFFRMSKYQGRLLERLKNDPGFIRPERYRNEVVALLESGALEDLCVSRPKSRLTWGVELPFDTEYVAYVWFDALLNYVSALDWPDGESYAKFWPVAEHLVAKDILKPHAVFWPTMLMSLGMDVYKRLNVHGYWLVKDVKMSKSLGNVVDPMDMRDRYGVSAFRYFLLREMSFGSDASFTEEAFIGRMNADLANDLGNLFSRVLAMTGKYFGGVVPPKGESIEADEDLLALSRQAVENYRELFARMNFSRALESLWELVRACNRYVDSQAPWTLFKNGQTDRLGRVLYVLLEEMRRVAVHVWPVMPDAAEAMLAQLGQDLSRPGRARPPLAVDFAREADPANWGALTPGITLAPGSNLFPRVEAPKPEPAAAPEPKKAKAEKAPKAEKQTKPAPIEPLTEADIADFQKLDLRVVTILKAERVEGADKLLKVLVDAGEMGERQVVAGIAEFYPPEDLPGRQAILLANLKPRALRGVESRGMLLAVRDAEGLTLLSPGRTTPPGGRVS